MGFWLIGPIVPIELAQTVFLGQIKSCLGQKLKFVDEASLIQRKLLSQKKLTTKARRKHIDLNAKLFDIWEDYNTKTADDKKMSSMFSLEKVSTLYSNFNNDNFQKCIDDGRVSESEYESDSESD